MASPTIFNVGLPYIFNVGLPYIFFSYAPDDSPDDTAADTSEISTTGCTFEIVNGDLYEVCDNGLAGLESAPELAGNIVEAPGDLDRQKNIWDFVSTFDGSFKTSSQYEL